MPRSNNKKVSSMTVRCEPELQDAMKCLSKEMGMDLSSLVRSLLRDAIASGRGGTKDLCKTR
jgi:antitoxin component of RelBE/YafQ-DinJ toxin-antitoxin module